MLKVGKIYISNLYLGDREICQGILNNTHVYGKAPTCQLTEFNTSKYQGGAVAYGAAMLVVPAHDIVVDTITVYSLGRSRTGSSATFLTPVYEIEDIGNEITQYKLTTLMNNNNALLYDHMTSSWVSIDGYDIEGYKSVDRVYGVPSPLLVDDEIVTAYKYTVRRASSPMTLYANHKYLIGYQPGVYDDETQGRSVCMINAGNTYNQIVRCSASLASNRSYTEGNTVYFNDIKFFNETTNPSWNHIPYFLFNDEVFTDYGTPSVDPVDTINIKALNLKENFPFDDYITGAGYVFMPSVDITADSVTTYYKYSKVGSIDEKTALGYVVEVDPSMYDTVINTILTPENSSMVVNNVMTNPINGLSGSSVTLKSNGAEYDTYEFTIHPSNGGSITLEAGHLYVIGFSSRIYNVSSIYAETVMLPRTPTDDTYSKIALLDPELMRTGQIHAFNNTYGLPYIKFNNKVFTDYARTSYLQSELRTDEYNPIDAVFRSIKGTTDKVMFVIRHSERGPDYSTLADLTENGVRLARNLGKVLSDEDPSYHQCYYGGTNYLRTCKTAALIAEGRGDHEFADYSRVYAYKAFDTHPSFIDEDLIVLNEHYFYDNTSPGDYTSLIPQAKAHDYEHKVPVMVETLSNKLDEHNARLGVFVSHDYEVVPLISYASGGRNSRDVNGKLDLNGYDGKWVNYMSGVGIIVHSDGTWNMYPVRSLQSGTYNL